MDTLRRKIVLTCTALVFFCPAIQADELRQKVEKPVGQAITTRQQSQKETEEWQQQKEKLVIQLEQLQLTVKNLQEQKRELSSQVETQQKRVDEKTQKLADIKQIQEEMDPFVKTLADSIAALPENGLPFLQEERDERIKNLRITLADKEIPISEKFRKAMEALQVEAEYGLTIETYQKQITLGSGKVLVNIFRFGRLGLYFQSLDQQSCGMFDIAEGKWIRLPDSCNFNMQKAVEIASKRRPAELLALPLGRIAKRDVQ